MTWVWVSQWGEGGLSDGARMEEKRQGSARASVGDRTTTVEGGGGFGF
ncbi:hypothetical protein Acr_07g0015330 [Actinidia rufa]|uniref:Uncharacterized protein n=1 Tax=Actinidia rufa TaxID=165716 RepID=A0A7J0F0C7_9ERIC|nr:hypothetical protein Acr_07g0015330 [Actinidia rufa]